MSANTGQGDVRGNLQIEWNWTECNAVSVLWRLLEHDYQY